MFGLKVIKESKLVALQAKIEEDEKLISSLYADVASLESENKRLKEDTKKDTADAVVLLTDVAEEPLKTVERKVRKKVVKKTSNNVEKTNSHRTVVRKKTVNE